MHPVLSKGPDQDLMHFPVHLQFMQHLIVQRAFAVSNANHISKVPCAIEQENNRDMTFIDISFT